MFFEAITGADGIDTIELKKDYKNPAHVRHAIVAFKTDEYATQVQKAVSRN